MCPTLCASLDEGRAEAIARKAANGYLQPYDALTDEAMVAQAATHIAEVQKESERLNAERQMAEGRQRKKELGATSQLRMLLGVFALRAADDARNASQEIGAKQWEEFRERDKKSEKNFPLFTFAVGLHLNSVQ